MRGGWLLFLLMGGFTASGCSRVEVAPPSSPLVSGRLEGGTFWNKPLTAASNEGNGYPTGSQVEIYERFVVITTPDGLSHIHPQGYFSGLVIRRGR